MDVNDLRIAITVVSLLLFVALMLHTWSRRRQAEHEEAALLPFADESPAPTAANPFRGDHT